MSMFSTGLRSLYGGLWWAAVPLLRRNKRLKDGFEQRLVPQDWPFCTPEKKEVQDKRTSGSPLIWIQAASGGEATLVGALASALLERMQTEKQMGKKGSAEKTVLLLATTCTKQGMDILEKLATRFAGTACQIYPRYFPLDSPAIMHKALLATSPEAIVMLETELWPGLMHESKRQGIPLSILNARMTEKSFKTYRKFSLFFRSHQPELIAATTLENASRFQNLFATAPLPVTANIKFDLALEALCNSSEESKSTNDSKDNPPTVPLVSFASIREEEEELLLPPLLRLFVEKYSGLPVQIALAPRHLNRVAYWKALLDRSHVPFVLRSQSRSLFTATDHHEPAVLLWDTFGELSTLYNASDVAIVGGTFAPLGGQNFLEPVAAGVPTIIGPSWSNFEWIGEEIFSLGLVKQCSHTDLLNEFILSTLETRLAIDRSHWDDLRKLDCQQRKVHFTTFLQSRTGGAAASVNLLFKMIQK